MENNVDDHGFIHPEFMQCVTATGRLSSRNPNFQNMPRGNTFAIRKVVESRFEGGLIMEGDYSQPEFRAAGFLAKDGQVYADVKAGTDVHSYTASVIGCTRQQAKAHTFKPLYGGTTGTEDQKRYYRFKGDEGVTEWHDQLQRDAVRYKKVTLPSGREYMFPGCKGQSGVQQPTALPSVTIRSKALLRLTLLPLALVSLQRVIDSAGIQSVICNTVHDSIVMDVHPDEKNICIDMMKHAMLSLPFETIRRYGLATTCQLA